MKISRREFLQFLGVTGALAGGVSRIWAVPDEWREKLRSGPRLETWKVSTCGQCPAGCGIRVRLIDDIPVRILGNPIAPVNNGFLCPMGEAGLELLYHPDRITKPLRRKGKKGEHGWEPVSWEDAMKQITLALREQGKGKQPGRFGFLMGDGNTLLTQFAGDFTSRLGSSHFFPWRALGVNELGFLQGSGEYPPFAFDLKRTDYLITFGANLLEEPLSPVYFNRIYGGLKAERARTGLKMVHVDARMSQAGRNATEWVQIRPGSMGVLALGLAYVIFRYKTEDQEFIGRYSEDFRKGGEDFRTLVTRDYSPDRVSDITGVPAQTILRLAREFGSAKAPLALAGGTSASSETGLLAQWAVASLNALAGSFSAQGLWRDPVPLPWGPSSISAFTLRSGGFSRIPLVVQCATLVDDTSPFADLVLPLTTPLEQWNLTLPSPNLPFSQLGLQHPITLPLPDARPLGDILLHLGREAGVDPFPGSGEKPYAEYVQARMKEIFASGKGTPYFEAVSLEFLEDLRKRGWQVYSYPAFADFWRLLQEKGGWWDPGEYPEADWNKRKKFTFPTAAR